MFTTSQLCMLCNMYIIIYYAQTNDEWRTLYLSPPLNTSEFMQNSRLHAPLVGGSLPDSVDWRQYGYVTQVNTKWFFTYI